MRTFSKTFAALAFSPLLFGIAACGAADTETDEGTTESDALATTTRSQLLANDTSASSLFRDEYTPAARFFGADIGVVSNGDNPAAATTAATLGDGAVSKVSLHTLLPAGSTKKILIETQSWFCTNGAASLSSALGSDQCGSHIDIGYAVNTTAQTKKQVADMKSRGADGAIIDWHGSVPGKGALDVKSTSSAAINAGALFGFKAAAEGAGGFVFAASEDEGAKASAAAHGGDYAQGVVADIAFLASNFFGSSAYYKVGGRPVVFFFGVDVQAAAEHKTVDWDYVRAHAPGNPLFVFENTGHAHADGDYAWPKPTPIGSYPGSDPFDQKSYLPYFYSQITLHPTELSFGLGYKGFDDHVVNGWVGPKAGVTNPPFVNGRRYSGQQCGKTWLDSFAAANAHASDLAGVQIATWDDYEEGTEIESGIDNHLAIAAHANSGTLTWSIGVEDGAPADCTSAISAGFDLEETIDHFSVYASPSTDGENLTLVADDIPASTRSLPLAGKVAAGTWKLYVRAVAKPSITNKLSAAVVASVTGSTGGDGCTGVPTILEPTSGEAVGTSIHLRVTAPACIQSMIAYIDGKEVAKVTGGQSIDQWVPVTTGDHVLNVNGWAGTSEAHLSSRVSFHR